VVSIVPFKISETKPGLVPPLYEIEASVKGEPQILVIGTAIHYVYIDETRGSLQVRDSSAEVARSIVEDYSSAQLEIGDGIYPGLFWIPGEYSAKEIITKFPDQLAAAKIAQHRWFLKLTQLADKDWNRYHQHNVISDFQRRAAEIIGLSADQHDWMNQATTLNSTTCPACNALVKIDAVVCSTCRCILNPEKHKTLSFATA
jgi:hypothetical protein